MINQDQEREVKFYIRDKAAMERRLIEMSAKLVRERTFELNLRFDTRFKRLSRRHRLLRLRKNHSAFLTYKGRSQVFEGVFSRQEIEFEVGDFEAARRLIEAIGFRIVVIYEKFRTTYTLDDLEITIDELPYGDFVEIEGETVQQIRDLAAKLNLNGDNAVLNNYLGLFHKIKQRENYHFRDLTFENFSEHETAAYQLGVIPAD